MKWTVEKEAEWQSVIPDLLSFCGPVNKWKLRGEMGAGKTSLVKALGRFWDIHEVVSPTFAIVNDYVIPREFREEFGELIHHIDLYRLENEEELIGIGFEEYLKDPHFTIVEWPEISDLYWPDEFVDLQLSILNGGKRKLLVILHTAQ